MAKTLSRRRSRLGREYHGHISIAILKFSPKTVLTSRHAFTLSRLTILFYGVVACSSVPRYDAVEPCGTRSIALAPRSGQHFPRPHVPLATSGTPRETATAISSKDDATFPAPALNCNGHTWHHQNGILHRIVSQGGKVQEVLGPLGFKSGLRAFEDQLRPQEISAALTYLKGLWGDQTSLALSIR